MQQPNLKLGNKRIVGGFRKTTESRKKTCEEKLHTGKYDIKVARASRIRYKAVSPLQDTVDFEDADF